MAGGVGYALARAPRFDVGAYAGVAVMAMAALSEGGFGEVEASSVDPRLGLEMRLSLPVVSPLGVVFALDADLSPTALADPGRRLDPTLPKMPSYSIGLSAGVEVGVP